LPTTGSQLHKVPCCAPLQPRDQLLTNHWSATGGVLTASQVPDAEHFPADTPFPLHVCPDVLRTQAPPAHWPVWHGWLQVTNAHGSGVLGGGVLGGGVGLLHACVLQVSVDGSTQAVPPFTGAGELHARTLTPPPHALSHPPHADQPPLMGHACVLQLSVVSPEHSAPPCAGDGALHTRVLLPPPHVWSHALQSDKPPSTGQGVFGQVVDESPAHPAPCRGLGLVQERVLMPPSPQEAVQADQADHPPSLHSRDSVRPELPSSAAHCAPQVVVAVDPSVPVWHWLGSGLLHKRLWTLLPHVPHADQPPSIICWQLTVPQSLVVNPTQSVPPFEASGLLQMRDCVPPPHVAVHVLQSLQPPSMACVAPRHASLQCVAGQLGGLAAQLLWHHAS